MRLAFSCPGCQTELEIPAEHANQAVRCPTCGTKSTAPKRTIGPGLVIGGFCILQKLGSGGMGDVYLARQRSLDRDVALKILHPHVSRSEDLVDRFLTEVRLLARLEHPFIVNAYEAGTDEGVLFLAMAYIRGESLESKIKKSGHLPEAEALAITLKTAQALSYAWSEFKLLHRDIKPSNILLDPYGEPRLADFGLAKSLTENMQVTISGSIMGTPNYMSPEQALDAAKTDIRADMYSLGATLYHTVTGQLPFRGSSVVETLRKQATEHLPDPRQFHPELSDATLKLLEIMLATEPENRHETWEALIEDIRRVIAGNEPLKPLPAPGASIMTRSASAPPAAGNTALPQNNVPPPGGNSAQQGKKPPATSSARMRLILASAGGILWLAVLAGAAILAARHFGFLQMPWLVAEQQTNAPPQPPPAPPPPATQAVAQALTPPQPPPQPPPAPPPPPPPDPKLIAIRNALDEALQYARNNLNDPEGASKKLNDVALSAKGTPLEHEINNQIRRLKTELEAEATEKVRVLRKRVATLTSAGEFDKARALVMMDGAPFSNQLSEARRQLLEDIATAKEEAAQRKALEAMMARKRAEELAEKALVELREETARHLLRMDFSQALAGIGRACDAAQTAEATRQITALSNLVSVLREYPLIIADSFRKTQGRPITIALKAGRSMTNTITAVDGDRITVQRQLPAGWVEQTITVADLALSEKLTRLAEHDGHETTLARALLVHESGNPALAIRILQDSDHPFAVYIAAAIQKSASQPRPYSGTRGPQNQRPTSRP